MVNFIVESRYGLLIYALLEGLVCQTINDICNVSKLKGNDIKQKKVHTGISSQEFELANLVFLDFSLLICK